MSEIQRIESTLRQAGRRRRWQRAWRWLWQGLLAAGLLWLVVLGVYKLLPLPLGALGVAGGVAMTVVVGAWVIGFWRRDRLSETARWVDREQALQERLSTALELSRNERAGRWRELLLADAAGHLGAVDLRRLLPFRLPQVSRWVLLVLALGAGLGFVPEYRSQAFRERQRDREIIREAGRQLAELTRRQLERRDPALSQTREALESVGELGRQLAQTPPVRPEALRDLAQVTKQVEDQARELASQPALRSMERAARSLGQNLPGSAEALERRMAELQQALGSKEGRSDALDKLQRELEQAQRAAANMAGQNSPGSAAQRQQLAKALSSLAQQAAEMGAVLPSLEQALAALDAGQIDRMLKDLEVAAQDLEKLLEMAKALEQMQAAAEKLGKDLAEQLKSGQAEAARQTLRQMANQLQSGQLSVEQLDKIMQEVSQAIPPAAPYGKVPEHLKEALRQMQAGRQPQAAQSLAEAAKELENLMQQLADAKDLQSSLEALKRAQLCVGNGVNWGQGQGQPGFKPGGKPGRGVGTWAEETGWIEPPENTGLWDNSGIERPDMDPRGHSDRGEGEVPEGLVPTKVRGQFNPGGPMPSITLKGVSIKGESTVAVQQAVTAAQSEAQAALSQDQVPRAYQGAVKGYFDDLKE
ncbi:MAG: hypothetical protein FJ387_20785 [Verrucomicrobia bacterium]|nr:hypothetical protein [Verrucomicrobiota bacterium]